MNNIDSFPELGIEYVLPFYLRSTGYNSDTPRTEFPNGYIRHYIAIVLDGECILQAGTYIYHLHKNDGFFMRAHFPFSYYKSSQKCVTQWISFDGYATIPLFSKLNLENYMIFRNLDTMSLTESMSTMYLTSINTDKSSRLKNSAMTYKLLIDIYTQSEQGIASSSDTISNNSLLMAKSYIEQYYYKELTQIQIAEHAGITPQHLCRLFNKYLNTSPINYLNNTRITHAKYMLRTTTLPIITIGEKVGYSTPHYFSSTFRRLEGHTPGEYRKIAYIAAHSN